VTGRQPQQRTAWEARKAADRDALAREWVARRHTPELVPLDEDAVKAFTGQPGGPHGYVMTRAEAAAHAWATSAPPELTDAAGDLAVVVDARGTIRRWP